MQNYEIIQAKTKAEIEQVKTLFLEYSGWVGEQFCFDGFDKELASLPGKYSLPEGRLYLALLNGKSIGCIGIKKIDEGICEMKRLYVRPEARGMGLGKRLVELIICEAKNEGYNKMRLDTLHEKMNQAQKLYREAGFYEIEPYNNKTIAGILYMELDLTK